MNNHAELPKRLVWVILVLCAAPFLLNRFGLDFGVDQQGLASVAGNIVFSETGRPLLLDQAAATFKAWDAQSQQRNPLYEMSRSAGAMTFSPPRKTEGGALVDSRYFAAAGSDFVVRLWDLDTESESIILRGHQDAINALAFSHDGKLLATASNDATLRLWDAATGQERQRIVAHAGGADSVAFTRDGRTLATGGADHEVKIWDASSGRLLHRLSGHVEDVRAVAFSPDGKQLVSADSAGTLRVWQVDSGQSLTSFRAHNGRLLATAFDSQGTQFATAGAEGLIRIWDAARFTQVAAIPTGTDWISAVALSDDGRNVVIAGEPGASTFLIWDLKIDKSRMVLRGPADTNRLVRRTDPAEALRRPEVRGALVFTILEWSACAIAIFTGVLAFIHYLIRRDVTTPIIGTALFFSGMLDAFQTLAADQLIGRGLVGDLLISRVVDLQSFLPFTWAISRTFNVCIMIVGAGMFLGRGRDGIVRTRRRGLRFVVLIGILFGLVAYAIVHVCASLETLPRTIYADQLVSRPWDMPPLILLLIAGTIIFPRFHRQYPSLFSHGLFVSVVPHILAQIYAAFGSTEIFDNAFNIALYQKNLAYLVPLAGLILDYTRKYQVEAELVATEEKLKIARDVQRRLLPVRAPTIPGVDLAGLSIAAEAVGGDYFDYIPMANGAVGVLVADVSGHDLGASIFMAQTRAYLRALAQAHESVDQIVLNLNRFLEDDSHGRRFVTLFIARYEPAERMLTYTAAGHQGYLLDSVGGLHTLGPTCPPLGVIDDQVVPAATRQQLKPGNILIELTDGIVEARSPHGEYFGLERVRECLLANRDQPALRIAELLCDAARAHCETQSPEDDITVVVMKVVDEAVKAKIEQALADKHTPHKKLHGGNY